MSEQAAQHETHAPVPFLAEVHEMPLQAAEPAACTCIIVNLGSHITPTEWEQNPWCELHPDVRELRALFNELHAQQDDLLRLLDQEYERIAEAEQDVASLQIELGEIKAPQYVQDQRSLPDQEWCEQCEGSDGAGEPRDVIDISIEVDVRTIWGTGPEYRVIHLSCGHAVCQSPYSRRECPDD